MKNAKQLREERSALIEKMNGLMELSQSEERNLTEDEQKSWDEMDAKTDELKSQYEKIERQEALNAEKAAAVSAVVEGKRAVVSEEETRSAEFRSYLTTGAKSTEMRTEAAQTAGSDAQGGYLVPQGFADQLDAALKAWGGVRDVAQVITTATGNTMDFPMNDDTAAVGSILAEATADSLNDMQFTNVQIGAYTYTSGLVKVSYQLLQDSAFDLEAYLAEALGTRLGRATNAHYTTGTGSSQPKGIITGATSGVTAAATDAVTRDELLDLLHSVDPLYRANGYWMMNDATLKAIKKLTVGSGDDRPLWQPSMVEGEPSLLEGKPVIINQDMADLGAGSKSIAFGDFNKYLIRDVAGARLIRLDERFADELAVGFIAYMRTDGDFITSGNAVKFITQAAA